MRFKIYFLFHNQFWNFIPNDCMIFISQTNYHYQRNYSQFLKNFLIITHFNYFINKAYFHFYN